MVAIASFIKWRVQFFGARWLSILADAYLGWHFHRSWNRSLVDWYIEGMMHKHPWLWGPLAKDHD
jgi:hypothetical protein